MNADNMAQVLIFAGTIAVILVILVEIFKRSLPSFPSRFLPLVAVVLGVIVGAISYPFTDLDLSLRLWAGFFAGASSVGLYELGSKTTKKPPDEF